MSDTSTVEVGGAAVDPDETQFRADTLLMHAELVELELYEIRRRLFQDPAATKINVGVGNPAEQTLRGYQRDPFNGVIIYNPTPATLSIGFQAGAGVLAPATVPPFMVVTFPERYVNLSIAVTNPADQQQTITQPVTVLRTKTAPPPFAAPFTSPAPPQPLTSLVNAAAVQMGTVLDLGYPRANHAVIATSSAGVTGGQVSLMGSHDNVNWTALAGATTFTGGGQVFNGFKSGTPLRYVAAAVTTAMVGGTVTATVASS